MNILLTCAGRRNYLVNYFKEALGGNGKVIATDTQLNAPALVEADIAIKVPSIYSKNYIGVLLEICQTHKVGGIISLNDLELPILAENKSLFETLGIHVIVSEPSVIQTCFDKWKTVQFLHKIGLKAPKTFLTLEEALQAIESNELKFPLVIKPRWGSASIGVEFPETVEELKLTWELLNIRLSKTILSQIDIEDNAHTIIIQERLAGQEYGMDILNDFKGNFIAAFTKKKLAMRAGETDKSVSIINEKFDQIGKMLGDSLGHIGNLDCDLFLNKDGISVLELNPRFGGGYPFTHESGGNIVGILVEWLKGNIEYKQFLNFTAGRAFSKCDRIIKIPL